MTNNHQIPAVVVGLEINGLGVVRALHSENVPVFVLDTNFKSASAKTRLAKKVAIRSVEGEMLVEDLINFAKSQNRKPVLFLTMERSVRTVSEFRDRLKDFYYFTMPDHPVLMALMDKNGVLHYAEKSDIRYPKTANVTKQSDIEIAKNFTFPCIFKPATQNVAYGNQFKKAYKVNSLGEIKDIYDQVKSVQKEMIIQEWIEGGDSDIYFLLEYINKEGRVVADFPGRKVRSWPPNVGGTASCTSAYDKLNEMRQATKKYFETANFIGMGGIEFKMDRRTNELLMIEPTVARTDMQHEVSIIHGENLVYAQYCSEIGIEFKAKPRKTVSQKIWKVEPINRYSRSTQNTQEQDQIENELPSIDSLARLSDPLPFIYYLCGIIGDKLKHICQKIIKK